MEPWKKDQKIDIVELLKDLDKYEPRRRGWTWREKAEDQHMGPFEFHGQVHGRHRPAAYADHHH